MGCTKDKVCLKCVGHCCASPSCILFHSVGSEGKKLISTYIDNNISLVGTKSLEVVFYTIIIYPNNTPMKRNVHPNF